MDVFEFKKMLDQCQAAVSAGQVPRIRPLLETLNTAQIPDSLRLPFAGLCRRIGLNDIGLRLLNPLVTGGRELRRELPQDLLAELAVLLQRTGVLEESEKILLKLDPSHVPHVFLYRSFVHFNRWEYHQAVPLLRQFIEQPLESYDRFIGCVNLAAALASTDQFREAESLLGETEVLLRDANHRRLYGNCQEILAQIYLRKGEMSAAKSRLEKAQEILRGEKTINELSVLKWIAVWESIANKSVTPLQNFRGKAVAMGDWEALRHTDLYILKADFTPDLFHYHLFGSPWLGYRESAQRVLGRVIDQSTFVHGVPGGPIFDLQSATVMGKEVLQSGGVLHRTLDSLLRDFYRPITVGALFAAIFPGEHFDVFSSPNRVHQAVFRLRQWVDESGYPIEIEQTGDTYSLKITAPFGFKIQYERQSLDQNFVLLNTIRDHFGASGGFTMKQSTAELGVPVKRMRSFCAWAADRGDLVKVGAGSSTFYQIRSHSLNRAG